MIDKWQRITAHLLPLGEVREGLNTTFIIAMASHSLAGSYLEFLRQTVTGTACEQHETPTYYLSKYIGKPVGRRLIYEKFRAKNREKTGKQTGRRREAGEKFFKRINCIIG